MRHKRQKRINKLRNRLQKLNTNRTKKRLPLQQAGGGLLSWARDKWRTSEFGIQSTADKLRSEITPSMLSNNASSNIKVLYIDKSNLGDAFSQSVMNPLTLLMLKKIELKLIRMKSDKNSVLGPKARPFKSRKSWFRFSSRSSYPNTNNTGRASIVIPSNNRTKLTMKQTNTTTEPVVTRVIHLIKELYPNLAQYIAIYFKPGDISSNVTGETTIRLVRDGTDIELDNTSSLPYRQLFTEKQIQCIIGM